MILAGDIGGTKTVLALFEPTKGDVKLVRDATFPSRESATFEELLAKFTKGGPPPTVACFGVAGPVVEGRVHTTNLPWTLDESALARTLGIGRAKLLNDLEAAAFGMLHVKDDERRVLNRGARGRRGHIAVVAAGTGLGEALLYWDGEHHHPVASEGGHTDFAPRTDVEIDLLNHLRPKFGGHVSYERILSGNGIHAIYEFLRDTGRAKESPSVAAEMKTGDPNATIGRLGAVGQDPLCVATLDLFASIYGAEAGNLALKCFAAAVFVGGGIAPKILPLLERGGFMRAFAEKGRLSDLMKSIEVSVVLNPRAPLLGAAHFARRLR